MGIGCYSKPLVYLSCGLRLQHHLKRVNENNNAFRIKFNSIESF